MVKNKNYARKLAEYLVGENGYVVLKLKDNQGHDCLEPKELEEVLKPYFTGYERMKKNLKNKFIKAAAKELSSVPLFLNQEEFLIDVLNSVHNEL